MIKCEDCVNYHSKIGCILSLRHTIVEGKDCEFYTYALERKAIESENRLKFQKRTYDTRKRKWM